MTEKNKLNLGIIGYGYWGPNLVRNFYGLDNCTIKYVCDLRTERLSLVSKLFPSINLTGDYNSLLKDPEVDAVAVATPVGTHYNFAKLALEHDKHVLVEKPMTDSYSKAKELIDIALKKNKVLMIDHTFLYTGAVKTIRKLIDGGTLGRIQYFDSTRINLGLFQQDINVLWDLASHDLSILSHLINEKPHSIRAVGVSHTVNKIENIAYLILHYPSGMIAHFNCSWSSPVKIRQILIGGDKKMIVYNDIETSEKVKVYDTGYDVRTDEDKQKLLVDYRVGDVYSPKVDIREALTGLVSDFKDAVLNGTDPLSNWKVGLEVVKILEASDKSLKDNSKEIPI
ncbi:MAG: Gfo/Idh/MocA family protein [Ignavibacteria bacterium]